MRLPDRHTPAGADGVPHELVVAFEDVERPLDAVVDAVAMLPSDRAVRIADADAGDTALYILDLEFVRRLSGRADIDVLQAVDPVLGLAEAQPSRDLAED